MPRLDKVVLLSRYYYRKLGTGFKVLLIGWISIFNMFITPANIADFSDIRQTGMKKGTFRMRSH